VDDSFPGAVIKTRVSRARAMLRRELSAQAEAAFGEHVPLPAHTRCDRVVAAVLARIL
jgi:hypothetical protein